MIELAAVTSIVGLFKDLLDVADRRAARRREFFEHTCQPLYEHLKPIVKDYYAIIDTARTQLQSSKSDLATIVGEIANGRSKLIIARDGIIGEAHAFERRHGEYSVDNSKSQSHRRKFDNLADDFAHAIVEYFESTVDIDKYSIISTDKDPSRSTYLFILSEALRTGNTETHNWPDEAMMYDTLKDMCNDMAIELEEKWRSLSEKYAALKVYSER